MTLLTASLFRTSQFSGPAPSHQQMAPGVHVSLSANLAGSRTATPVSHESEASLPQAPEDHSPLPGQGAHDAVARGHDGDEAGLEMSRHHSVSDDDPVSGSEEGDEEGSQSEDIDGAGQDVAAAVAAQLQAAAARPQRLRFDSPLSKFWAGLSGLSCVSGTVMCACGWPAIGLTVCGAGGSAAALGLQTKAALDAAEHYCGPDWLPLWANPTLPGAGVQGPPAQVIDDADLAPPQPLPIAQRHLPSDHPALTSGTSCLTGSISGAALACAYLPSSGTMAAVGALALYPFIFAGGCLACYGLNRAPDDWRSCYT